ncbi:kek1 [Culex quinquefasciatus]|uniref:Kek1 n=1 Tax=Culex quinquefasciatus TaxID=7176 RepID=B0XC47_CULQU|nr:kek1 [Culex quinquefasciatus]|eukprot:XP_001867219.1 kek1 [Culex quinquefasciatus]
MWFTLVILGTLFNTMRLVTGVDGCPSEVCVCKWKGGKQTVECGGRMLSRIPEGMDPGTQVLNFSGNGLTILQSERFKKMDLINLQKIYMARNQLIKIHDRAFRGLTNLVELDLSENMLPVVPTETFADYPALMRLTLSGNPIRTLRTNAFKHLSFLTTLELSNCQIEMVEDEAFIGMDNLEWLRLDGNRITTIQGNHVLPGSLHGINLQANRWQCDCRLLDVHTWLNSFNVPQREEPKCSGPLRLAGQTIKSVRQEDLACLPIITPDSLYREIAEGRNMTLTCTVTAIPEPIVSWWFQGQMLQNDSMLAPNLHLYHYNDNAGATEEKRSELLIFNAGPDENGTFSCIAENSAGRVQANYTLHVIVKEEPVVEEVTFSQEYFLVIVGASAATGFLLFLILCIIICRCSRSSGKRRSKSRGKSGSDTTTTSQKCSSITNDIGEPLTCAKINGTVSIGDSNQQDVVLYLSTGNNHDKSGMNNLALAGGQVQFCSPPSARSYQDQNPDLINDAESGNKIRPRQDHLDSDVGEKDSDEQSSVQDASSEASYQQNYFQQPTMAVRQMGPRFSALSTLPRGVNKDMYQHQVDIHLSPGCFLDQNGYPIDLNMMTQGGGPPVNYFRTLPHNRGQKGQPNANKIRYSNDAEFITRTSQTYQFYGGGGGGGPGDIRYTAEGYPQPNSDGSATNPSQFPSPPDGYKGEPPALAFMNPQAGATATFCVNPGPATAWPAFLPAGYHPQLIQLQPTQPGQDFNRYLPPPAVMASPSSSTAPPPVLKKCVGAQTTDDDTIPEQREEEEEESAATENGKLRHLTGPLADSPDEGYVGDGQESTDI